MSGFLRGREQIRTAVQGFADLCLATRPRDHFLLAAKIEIIQFENIRFSAGFFLYVFNGTIVTSLTFNLLLQKLHS